MLARRLLKRGRQGFPKTLVASHVRRYEPERWVAAWTIASVSASNNPSKYANTILTSGFTRRHERPDQDRRDDGSDPEATFQRHFAAASAAFDGWPRADDVDGEGDAR